MAKEIENRNELILTGLYLSKFDRRGLEKLGFGSFQEAFNVLGYALNGKPASIKNYRDEFDPYFENERQGWHNRKLRDYCKKAMESAKDITFDDFTKIISGFLVKDYGLKIEIDKFLEIKPDERFINRVSTGLAAENYFIENYKTHFMDYSLQDTRQIGCGFDFKMNLNNDFVLVEVKGLQRNTGNFLLTEKEYNTAEKFKEKYCLYIVKNFHEKPYEDLFFNPIENFQLKKIQQEIVQISYQGNI